MEKLSYLLAVHPKKTLLTVVCTLIPIASFFLIYPLQIRCDVRRGFANEHGRAVKEFERFSQFYNMSVEGLEIWGILVRNRTNGQSLTMSQHLLDEVERLHKYIWAFNRTINGQTVSFAESATTDINYVFNYYKQLYPFDGWLPDVNLSYPTASAFGTTFFIGSQFFGVNLNESVQEGPIKTSKFVLLWYMSKTEVFEERQRLQAVQMGIFEDTAHDNFSDMFSVEMFGDQVANAEMLRGTLTTVKLFVAGAALMIAFMAFTFSDLTFKSQVFLIIGAIGSPLAATCTCFSLLGWFGQPFNSIMCITPFLILGIGVDDAFLLLNCWRRDHTSNSSTYQRLLRVVVEISPSMAITSLTNTMAFSVGFLSPTPQMSSFCLCTALAIMLDFIFEFLIFVPLMVLFYEEKSTKKKIVDEKRRSLTWKTYTKCLLSFGGTVTGALAYVIVMGLAYYGTSTLKTAFDPSKTFPSDSRLVDALANFNQVQEEYSPVNYLTTLPDPQNNTQVEQFEQMLRLLENRKNCYGSERNTNIYWDFKTYLASKNSTENNYNELDEFLMKRGMKDLKLMRYHKENNKTIVDTLNFVVICKGQKDWGDRAMALESARKIIDGYPQFNISLFDYDATIYDLIITVKMELIKSVLITFSCMTMACFVIMPSCIAPTIASIATLSISFCLCGFLSLWGQNLDPVTMIDVIMAIGFSVDYSAHVCFHYYCACKSGRYSSKKQIIGAVLSSVGRPLTEASLTTLLCMLPLFIVPVYIIRSFAKTVVLVTVFGLSHGLLFLPLFLCLVPLRKPSKHFVAVPTSDPIP